MKRSVLKSFQMLMHGIKHQTAHTLNCSLITLTHTTLVSLNQILRSDRAEYHQEAKS